MWLKDERVSSLDLYADYRKPDFTPHRIFPLERLCLTPEGDVLVAVTTDEADPTAAPAPPRGGQWTFHLLDVAASNPGRHGALETLSTAPPPAHYDLHDLDDLRPRRPQGSNLGGSPTLSSIPT